MYLSKLSILATQEWKSVDIYNVARMGRKFDDYPGLQQKNKCAHRSVTQCSVWLLLFTHENSSSNLWSYPEYVHTGDISEDLITLEFRAKV